VVNLFLFLCGAVCFQYEAPVITWEASKPLQWEDFKGIPDAHDDAAALTVSGITFRFIITETDAHEVVKFSTEVFAYFYPEESWYKKNQGNTHILEHEQLHFDITALYARKFRYRISQLKVSNGVKRQLKKIHKDINTELAQMQIKYDIETDYSRNFQLQAKWKSYIEAELLKYAEY